MLSYIPYTLMFFMIHGTEPSPERNNANAAHFLFFHAVLTNVSHTASIWLTVSVAIFRFIFLSSSRGSELCSFGRSHLAIAIICLLSVFLNMPQFFLLKINSVFRGSDNDTLPLYVLSTNRIKDSDPKLHEYVTILMYTVMAVLVKIGPGLLMIVLSCLLLRILWQTQRRYTRLQKRSSVSRAGDRKRSDQTHQTTKLLVAVVIVFTLSELPQGILFTLNLLVEKFENTYYAIASLLDLMTIVTCTINFVLYCCMSSQFRTAFMKHCNCLPDCKFLHIINCAKCRQDKSELGPEPSTTSDPPVSEATPLKYEDPAATAS